MVLAYPTDLEASGGLKRGYEQYRETRAKMLEAYCFGVLFDNRSLDTVVAIGMDAHSSRTGRKGGSEDLFAMRINTWTEELEATAAEAREYYDILRDERLIKQTISQDEFPVLDDNDAKQRWSKNKPSRLRFKKRKR
jgi:hypothetical protein